MSIAIQKEELEHGADHPQMKVYRQEAFSGVPENKLTLQATMGSRSSGLRAR